jgi:two-component system, NarL family, response regulator DevR
MNNGPARIRVLLAEDHRIVAEGLTSLLESYPDIEMLGWFPSVAETVEVARERTPDVAVLDFRLADGTGATAAAGIREVSPATALVFLSADASEESLIAAVEAGACGYLIKSAGADEVACAVRRAAEGEMLIPADQLAALLVRSRELAQRQRDRGRLREAFTSRELEVLALMVDGLDNRALAAQLSVSYATARTHVRNVLQKLGARSKLEAVVKATESGLIEPASGEADAGNAQGADGTDH